MSWPTCKRHGTQRAITPHGWICWLCDDEIECLYCSCPRAEHVDGMCVAAGVRAPDDAARAVRVARGMLAPISEAL